MHARAFQGAVAGRRGGPRDETACASLLPEAQNARGQHRTDSRVPGRQQSGAGRQAQASRQRSSLSRPPSGCPCSACAPAPPAHLLARPPARPPVEPDEDRDSDQGGQAAGQRIHTRSLVQLGGLHLAQHSTARRSARSRRSTPRACQHGASSTCRAAGPGGSGARSRLAGSGPGAPRDAALQRPPPAARPASSAAPGPV